jgi:hypothetical protein
MATRPEHDQENRFPRNFARKNFGEANNGGNFVQNTAIGGLSPFFGLAFITDDSGFALPFNVFVTGMAVALGSIAIDYNHDTKIDLNPTHAITEQHQGKLIDGVSANVYRHEGTNYLLRHDGEQVQLYAVHDREESLTDDVFVPVSGDDAPAIARKIAQAYKAVIEQHDRDNPIDIYSEFEAVTEGAPFHMQYGGISAVLEDPENGQQYIIADNVEGQIKSPANAMEYNQQSLDEWESALTKMAYGQYGYDGEAAEYISLDELDSNKFLIALGLLGGLAGFGASIGGAYSVASSRRRYNRELGVR